MKKEEGLQLLKEAGIRIENVESLNLALLAIGDILKAEKKEIPEQLINPEKYEEISLEHLGLIRDRAREASASEKALSQGKETPELMPSTEQEEGKITNAQQGQDLAKESNEAETNRDKAISSLRAILSNLETTYVAQAIGQSLSDEFWLALDQAKAMQDQKHLERKIGELEEDFNEAIDAIEDTKQKRQIWENESLERTRKLSNFSSLGKKLEAVQKM